MSKITNFINKKRYTYKEVAVMYVAALITGFMFWGVAYAIGDPKATGETKPAFDHSQCQYPERTTNPPNGCDNTDPANPACAVKGLPEDCTEGLEQPTKPTPKPEPKQQPKPAPGCYN